MTDYIRYGVLDILRRNIRHCPLCGDTMDRTWSGDWFCWRCWKTFKGEHRP